MKGETKHIEELTPQELNKLLSEFLKTVRKKEDKEEYEPNSLRMFFASFELHLKKKKTLWTYNEKCPVKSFKVYEEKRPAKMKTDDAPFLTWQ